MRNYESDPSCCPLCGETNNCSLAARCTADPLTVTPEQFSCWCMRYQLSETVRDALNQQGAEPKTCLCERCLADLSRPI